MRWTDEGREDGRKDSDRRRASKQREEPRRLRRSHRPSVRDRPPFRLFLCTFSARCSGDFIAIAFINFLFTFKEATGEHERGGGGEKELEKERERRNSG